jgi:hypothetical protein
LEVIHYNIIISIFISYKHYFLFSIIERKGKLLSGSQFKDIVKEKSKLKSSIKKLKDSISVLENKKCDRSIKENISIAPSPPANGTTTTTSTSSSTNTATTNTTASVATFSFGSSSSVPVINQPVKVASATNSIFSFSSPATVPISKN